MQSRGSKRTRNYLDLFPVDTLEKIIFHLPEAARRNSIAKIPEFKEALLKHNAHLKTISEKALALVKEDKNLKAAAALVERHRVLLTTRFCQALANWTMHDVAAPKTFEIAKKIHKYAKELDTNCIVGTIVADKVEILYCDDSDDDDNMLFDYDGPDPLNWKATLKEYVKVIWVRFGDITVHYLLKPHRDCFHDPSQYRRGEIELNVYARTANEKVIYGKNSAVWVLDGEQFRYLQSSIGQVGEVESSDDVLVLASAIGLVAEVGRSSLATAAAHRVPENSPYIVEHVACALHFCGRNFRNSKAEIYKKHPSAVRFLSHI
jgi:hypothetical protein